MPTPVTFDPAIAAEFLTYARRLVARGYVHNTLGNIVMRAPHSDHPGGVAYTKHASISLEEMTAANIVITDLPMGNLVYGTRITSVGHNLNREVLRLRPDINAAIHVHDDATIGFFASGAFTEVRMLSADTPLILGKPPHYVPGHINVEVDVATVKEFIADTNLIVLVGHGITALGRSLSEAYHRLNSFTAEVRRNVIAEQLAAAKGTKVEYRSDAEVAEMYRVADKVVYPERASNVMG